jgi:hypothetical protein
LTQLLGIRARSGRVVDLVVSIHRFTCGCVAFLAGLDGVVVISTVRLLLHVLRLHIGISVWVGGLIHLLLFSGKRHTCRKKCTGRKGNHQFTHVVLLK